MTYEVLQKRRFSRQYKKLHDNLVPDIDNAVAEIAEQSSIGERKKGDLESLFVYKFYSQHQLYLLGYTIDNGICLIFLEVVSSYKNHYRDLKRK